LERGRKEKNFSPEESTSIGMKLGKGKYCFIKDNVSRHIDTSSGHIKAFHTFVHMTVAKKDALFGTEC
jgi:hypothetical protein